MHFEFTKHTKLYSTTSTSVITLKLETRRKGKNPITDTVVAVWGEREVVVVLWGRSDVVVVLG